MQEYWQKQATDKPLFPDILWSRPENRQAAGKLLIIGGNLHSFIAVGQAYQAAIKAGAGTVRIILPEALRRTVGSTLENCEFAASNISGSFARMSLSQLLDQASWADCVLLAGDFGRNSETAIVLESFIEKYSGLLVLTKDAIDYFSANPKIVLNRDRTCIVGTTAQLQKLAIDAHYTKAIATGTDLINLVDVLHEFEKDYQSYFITRQLDITIVAAEGKVSTTKIGNEKEMWRIRTAAEAAVFWMQNLSKPFEAISASLTSKDN